MMRQAVKSRYDKDSESIFLLRNFPKIANKAVAEFLSKIGEAEKKNKLKNIFPLIFYH